MTGTRIVVGAGGTAGHVVPALAVADALRASGAEVHFIGGDRAEASLVPAAGYALHRLRMVSMPRRSPLLAARAALVDGAAVLAAARLIRLLAPDAVLGCGGYVSAPVGLAAALCRRPLVTVEIDGHLGMANRLLAPLAQRVCTALPLAGHEGAKFVVTGRPAPEITIDRGAARERFGVGAEHTLVLVFGGSQGARSINQAALAGLGDGDFRVLHAAGDRDLPLLRAPGPGYDLRGYIPDLIDALVACDLVVARSGGSIWEICAAARPSILIPYPYATAGHQSANARQLERAGAAVVIPDSELNAARLRAEVERLLSDPARLAEMGERAGALARPHAAQDIADEVLRAAGREVARQRPPSADRGEDFSSPGREIFPSANVGPRGATTGADWSERRLHFVGIGGAGMSGLALIAHRLGAAVTGSDGVDTPYLGPLRAASLEPIIGYAAENVPAGAELVYSSAIRPDNPERQAAAAERGATGELHRSQLLGQLAALKRCLAVSGTAGKTTTTGMIVHVLRACGLDPAYAIGGALRSTGLNADWGAGEWIVIEADESDRSLLNYRPEIAVLTNADMDHHATYASHIDLERTFAEFTARARVAVVWDRPELLELAGGAGDVVPYDASEPELTPAGARFQWRDFQVQLALPGLHNAINAAGALSACTAAGADPAAAVVAIAGFQGAKRRMERLGESASGAWIYDDYAHHPIKVAAALAAARTLGARRVVAVFQPHLYSRTRALARELGAVLAAADLCGVLDVYPARERAQDFPGVSGHLVAAAAADAAGGRQVAWLPALDDARTWLDATLRPGDLCLLMGAGNIDTLGRQLVAPE